MRAQGVATPSQTEALFFNRSVHNDVEKKDGIRPKLQDCEFSSRVHRSECVLRSSSLSGAYHKFG